MAVVVALLMIGGEFDLSAGAMTGTTGLITGIMMSHWHVNVWVAILTSLVVALCIGFLNGLLVMKTGLPSFIVTLGTFFVLRGVNLAGVKQLINQVSVVDFQSAPGYAAGNKLFGSYIKIDLDWLPWVQMPATGFLRSTPPPGGRSASSSSPPGSCSAPAPATGSSPSAARRPARARSASRCSGPRSASS